ncbi:MAG: cytochrome-c peroxidase, partial [Bacteroidetes bacterium]|nr:cytochrome-c peroxidase [Bacteroidota bacterium]
TGSISDNTPNNNKTLVNGVNLGRHLFYDKRLSKNNTIACASCHLQEFAFTDTARFSKGYLGELTRRNSMALINMRWSPSFFWDSRAATLEEQILIPIQDQIEMGMTLDEMVTKLEGIGEYESLFEKAFGDKGVSSERVSKAISQFVRTLVSQNSRYDEANEKGIEAVFTQEEQLGYQLFKTHSDPSNPRYNLPDSPGRGANCADCHTLNTPSLSNFKITNNGLDTLYSDKGYGEHNSADKWQATFKTPGLRNIELTAPYMHDGRFKTLREVIDHYDSHIQEHRNLDNDIVIAGNYSPMKLDLLDYEKDAIIAFLKTLTDEKFINDERYSDPW